MKISIVFAFVVSVFVLLGVRGADAATLWTDAVCRVPFPALTRPEALVRTHRKLEVGEKLTIVAFGSSSTQGAGASAPRFTYPAQLEALLRHRAGLKIRVINHGIGGETIDDMRARLAHDVIAAKPDLVIWQVGSNAALRSMDPPLFDAMLEREMDRLLRAGADLILMDSQLAPEVDVKPGVVEIIAGVRDAAERKGVAFMPRHRIMEAWAKSPTSPGRVIGPDGLHINDHGYHYLAVLLADGITGRSLP